MAEERATAVIILGVVAILALMMLVAIFSLKIKSGAAIVCNHSDEGADYKCELTKNSEDAQIGMIIIRERAHETNNSVSEQ